MNTDKMMLIFFVLCYILIKDNLDKRKNKKEI